MLNQTVLNQIRYSAFTGAGVFVGIGVTVMIAGWRGAAEAFFASAAAWCLAGVVAWYLTRSMELSRNVWPMLRDADVLQHYDGATSTGDVRNKGRALPARPRPVELNYDLYQQQMAEGQTFFNFGISNRDEHKSIEHPRMQVEFPRVEGLVVNATANPGDEPWTEVWPNQVYTFAFPTTINATEAYSGTGVLRVTFPRRGEYPIKLTITGKGLRPVRRTLPVKLT